MTTRDEILAKLKAVLEHVGAGVTFVRFRQMAGVSERQVYRHWGDWKSLRQAAGLSPRVRPGTVYSDEELLAELNRVGQLCGEFPSDWAFDRNSETCWATIQHRFGKRLAVWERYREWLAQQPAEARPDYLREVALDADPASIAGVTDHKSPEERQRAIDSYNEQLLYLTPALLGPPPPGWQAGVGNRESVFGLRDSGIAEKESTADVVGNGEGEETERSQAAGGASGTGSPARRRPPVVNPVTELTPEEWNEFYNHPKAVPIVDIGAGLFPWVHRLKDPQDPRPNPPPWEFGMGEAGEDCRRRLGGG